MPRRKFIPDGVHRWDICSMCGPCVICGYCGNGCCNGGYGALADGSECTHCKEAYEIYDNKFLSFKDQKDKYEAFKKEIERATIIIRPPASDFECPQTAEEKLLEAIFNGSESIINDINK
jgi:hypothetical protein